MTVTHVPNYPSRRNETNRNDFAAALMPALLHSQIKVKLQIVFIIFPLASNIFFQFDLHGNVIVVVEKRAGVSIYLPSSLNSGKATSKNIHNVFSIEFLMSSTAKKEMLVQEGAYIETEILIFPRQQHCGLVIFRF